MFSRRFTALMLASALAPITLTCLAIFSAASAVAQSGYAASGSIVSERINSFRADAEHLRSNVEQDEAEISAIQRSRPGLVSDYLGSISEIGQKLSAGTTPGNPDLVAHWQQAETDLAKLDAMIGNLSAASGHLSEAAALAVYLQTSIHAAVALPGATDSQHQELLALQQLATDDANLLNQSVGQIGQQIERQSIALGDEHRNLLVLRHSIEIGAPLGRSLANNGGSQIASLTSPEPPLRQLAGLPAPSASVAAPEPAPAKIAPQPEPERPQPVRAPVETATLPPEPATVPKITPPAPTKVDSAPPVSPEPIPTPTRPPESAAQPPTPVAAVAPAPTSTTPAPLAINPPVVATATPPASPVAVKEAPVAPTPVTPPPILAPAAGDPTPQIAMLPPPKSQSAAPPLDTEQPLPHATPLLVVDATQALDRYESKLYDSVTKVLDRKPDAKITIFAVLPSGGGTDSAAVQQQAHAVADALDAFGIPSDHLSVASSNEGTSKSGEVRIYAP